MNPISKYVGWRHWAVLNYNSVFENFFVIFYIAIIDGRYNNRIIVDTLILIVFSIFATTYGYLINDFSDIELDRVHGKTNTFEEDPKPKAIAVILIITILSIITCYPFWQNTYFVILATSWFIIATFYSLKPIRLKERGTVGIFFVVMAQRVLPVLIIFSVFHFGQWLDILLILLYIFFRGFSSDVNHQLNDYFKDRDTGTKTFAVSKGYRQVSKAFYFSLNVERILLALILIRLVLILHLQTTWLIILFYALIALYFIAWGIHFIKGLRDLNERRANPFDSNQRNLVQFLHHAYPSVGLPVGLNILLIFKYFPFFWLLLIQIMVKRLYSIDIIKNNFLIRTLLRFLKI